MFCDLVIIIKILISSTAGSLDCQIWFHIFFIQAFFSSWLLLFTPGVLVEISLLFKKTVLATYIKTKYSQLNRILLIVDTCCCSSKKLWCLLSPYSFCFKYQCYIYSLCTGVLFWNNQILYSVKFWWGKFW